MLKPINLDNGVIQIHPFRNSDMVRQDKIVSDLYQIFGDKDSLPYNEERFVLDKDTISNQIFGVILGYQQHTRYTHYLTLKERNTIIGEISILSPNIVKESYHLEDLWLVEYFLIQVLWNKGIMTGVLKAMLSDMVSQGVKNIGALVNIENTPSIRVLEKAGFKLERRFDIKQNLYKFKL